VQIEGREEESRQSGAKQKKKEKEKKPVLKFCFFRPLFDTCKRGEEGANGKSKGNDEPGQGWKRK
jgi:hypothetical protein